MGVLGGDTQGWPNGRRLGDDVIDIAEQAVGGFLKGTKLPLGDGVNADDQKLLGVLPVRGGSAERLRQHEGRPEVVAPVSGGDGHRSVPAANHSHHGRESTVAPRRPADPDGAFEKRRTR